MRIHPIVSLLAAGLVAALPVHALAQETEDSVSVRDRPRPEFDAPGMQLGGFTLHGELNLGATSSDNVFAVETGEQDDVIYRLGGFARLASNWSRHGLTLEAGADANKYHDLDSQDSESAYVAGAGRLDVGSYTQFSAAARLAQEIEPRTDPDALIALEPVEYARTDMSFTARHSFNRFRVSATAGATELDYDDAGAVDQDFRDSDEQRLTGRIEAELTPRIALVLQATADERDYDNTPTLNSEGMTYLAGVGVNLTDLMRGEFTVGSFERDYDFGGSVEGTAIAGNLEWYATRLTTVTLNARQSGEESGAVVATPYTEAEYGVRVDHELLRNLILTAGVRLGQRDYELLDREDEYLGADVGFDYLINRRLAIYGRYQRDELESNGVDRYRDFDVGQVSAGLRVRL